MTRAPLALFPRYGDDIAPGFNLSITGMDAGKSGALFNAVRPFVESVTFEDDEEMSSVFQMTLINQPQITTGAPADWEAVVNSKAFAEGNFVDLYMGYGATRTFMDRAEIVKWLPNFPEEGPATLTITGYDGRHKMQHGHVKVKGQKKRKSAYKNLPDEQIVRAVANKYGYTTVADQTKPNFKASTIFTGTKRVTTQVIPPRYHASDKTDWEFIQRLAQINGFDLWVDYDPLFKNWVVNFRARADKALPTYQFEYKAGGNGSLLSASPDFSIKEQTTQVEVLVYDRKKRQVELTSISETVPGENVSILGPRVGPGAVQATQTVASAARVRFRAFGRTLEAFSDKPFRNSRQAANFVREWLKARERDFLILQGEVVGVPDLRARQYHVISGLSKRLNGIYRFSNVKHRMEPGSIYKCEFTAHKVATEAIFRPTITTPTF